MGGKAVSPELRATIAAACRSGEFTVAEVATRYDVSESSVKRSMKEHGVVLTRRGPDRALTPEEEAEVVRRFCAGESPASITRTLPVSEQTVHNTLERLGAKEVKSALDQEKRAEVVEACRGGLSVPEAARRFDVSESTVTRILRAYRAGGGEVEMPQGKPRTCDLNEAAFDEITPESTYWAGFLWADGCVHESETESPRLVCGLGEKDIVHLEKLRAFLGSTHAITRIEARPTNTFGGGPCVYLAPRSRRLCDALRARGFEKKRTRVPAAELTTSCGFWRGAIDGDGWLGTCGEGHVYPYIGLSGQIPILETFKEFVARAGIKVDLNIHRTETIWKVQTAGSAAEHIIRTLYNGAVVALDRKNERAQAIIAGELRKFAPYVEGPSAVVIDNEILV